MNLLFKTSTLQKTYTKSEDISDDASVAPAQSTLHYCDLYIPRGKFIAIVGESGTGKTTLLNMLGGLDSPDISDQETPPSIEINLGQRQTIDIVKEPDSFPHDSVGYIFQEGYLLLNATVGMNIALPTMQKGQDVSKQDLENIFKDLKLPISFLDRRAWQLSGGQAQRVAFARAISHDPKLIIADEPTNDLDTRLTTTLVSWLKKWCDEKPERSVLWVTHDLKQAAIYADGFIILRNHFKNLSHPLKNPGIEHLALIEQWVYSDIDIAPEYRIKLDSCEVDSTIDENKKASTNRIKLKAIWKVGLAEIFNRQNISNNKGSSTSLNAKLSLTDQNANVTNKKVSLWSWFYNFGQWSSVIVLMLITLLAVTGAVSWAIITQHFDNSVNDPRNCHIVVTGKLSLDSLSKPEIRKLGERPWEVQSNKSKSPSQTEDEDAPIFPLNSCNEGTAAFGRRDARSFEITLAQNGKCLHGDEVRLLITEPYEPILQKIFLLDPSSGEQQYSLTHFFKEVHHFPKIDEIYLTKDIEIKLLKSQDKSLLEQQICLVDDNRDWEEIYTVKGIINDLPSWGRQIFGAYITEEAYQAFARKRELTETFTNMVVYFSGFDVDRVEKLMDDLQLIYVKDNITKIRNLMTSSFMFKAIILSVISALGALLIFFIGMSVNHYLQMNAKSFAVLKSFGVEKKFIMGILMLQFSFGWIVSTIFLSIVALISSFSLVSNVENLTYLMIAEGFIIACFSVIFLGLAVAWGIVNHWWKQNKYVSGLLKSS